VLNKLKNNNKFTAGGHCTASYWSPFARISYRTQALAMFTPLDLAEASKATIGVAKCVTEILEAKIRKLGVKIHMVHKC